MNLLAGRVTAEVWAASYLANSGAGVSRHNPQAIMSVLFTDGTGANQFNKVYDKAHTLAQDANLDITLDAGLTDPFGATFGLSKLKVLLIENTGDGTLSLTSDIGIEIATIAPGGFFLWVAPSAAGIAVTSGDSITIANAIAAGSVRVVLCGS